MKARPYICVAIASLLALALLGAGQQSAEQLYKSGLYEEEVGGDLQKAITIYLDVLKRFPDSREVAARAQLRIGFCYEKLGLKEAEKAFRQVINNYPEQSGAVREAREKLNTMARAQRPSEKNTGELMLRKVRSGQLDVTARISPDGRYLARTDWATGDLSILDIATGEARNLTNKGPWTKSRDLAITMAWSPDGKQIAYGWMREPSNVEVRLVSLDNPVPRTIYKVDNPEIEGPFPVDWTPDGKEILINIEEVKGPRWFGAGGKLGLVSVADGSVRILKDLGSVDSWQGGIFFPRISPDGRWIAYSFQRGDPPNCDVFLLSVDGKAENVIVEHPAHDSFFGWAPDGKSILFSSDRTGALDAYILRVEDGTAAGQPELVKKDIGNAWPYGISKDGAFHYMVTKGAENVYLVRFDPDQGKILDRPLTPVPHLGGSSHSPAYSPDGKSLAFVSERGIQFRVRPVLCVRSLETGKDREFRPEISGLKQLRWSPDGSSILFLAIPDDNHYQICSINVGTGQVSTIFRCELPNNVESIESADWSRDGRSIYYVLRNDKIKGSRLLVRDLEKGLEQELFQAPQGETRLEVAASPDGKQMAILFRSWDPILEVILRIMPVEGGEPRDLHKFNGATSVGHTVWTPDGKSVLSAVTIGEKNTRSLWRVSVDSGEAENLGLEMTINRMSIHPDGRQIAVSSPGPTPQNPELWVMENFLPSARAPESRAAAKTGAAEFSTRRIWSGPEVEIEGTVSPDGRFLTFVDMETGDLAVRDLVAETNRRLTHTDEQHPWTEFAMFSKWSRDGRRIAYQWYCKDDILELRVLDLEDSSVRTIHRSKRPDDWAQAYDWSPDGRHVLATIFLDATPTQSRENRAGLISIEDGSFETIGVHYQTLISSFSFPQGFAFSPDGRFIVYDAPRSDEETGNRNIFIIAIGSGTESLLVDHPGNDEVVGWTPDGKGLLFKSDRNGSPDLWHLAVSEGTAQDSPRLIKPGFVAHPMGITSRGELYYGQGGSERDIYTVEVDPDTGKLLGSAKKLGLPSQGHNMGPSYSLDGKYLAYLSAPGGRGQVIGIYSPETGRVRELNPKLSGNLFPQWIPPEGRALSVLVGDKEGHRIIYKIDLQTGEATPIGSVADSSFSFRNPPVWSMDGKRFFYTGGLRTDEKRYIYTYDLETGKSERLPGTPDDACFITLSPDGKWLAFINEHGRKALRVIPTAGGEPREVHSYEHSDHVISPAWSADGGSIYLPKLSDPKGNFWDLYRISLDGREVEKTDAGLLWIRSLSASPDGRSLAFQASGKGLGEREVWVMENFLPSAKK